MAELGEMIDAFDRVVAMAVESAPIEAVEAAAIVGRRARSRRGYLGGTVVVALAGGTGSGKASMINAFAGEEVARTGALRPTTSQPLAWVPANPEPGVIRLLDDIGVTERIGQDVHDWLVVIDLPDTDSVATEHRAIVARLLPEVDAVVWVMDPEKYQDRVLHAEHLSPLAAHQDQFLFVLNQIDRIRPEEVPALVEDLRSSLRADGISDPVIIPTAADPTSGPAEGIAELVSALRGLGDAKMVVQRKLLTDLAIAADGLAGAAGVTGGRGTGFAGEWEALVGEISEKVAQDVVGPGVLDEAARVGRSTHRAAVSILRRRLQSGIVNLSERAVGGPGAMNAVRRLDGYLADLASRVEGDTAQEVRRVAGSIDQAVSSSVDTVAFGEAVTLPTPGPWTATLSWLRRVAAVVAVVSGLWLFDTVRASADLVLPVTVLLVALVAVVVPGVIAAAMGGRQA
ncbi:MAG: GTPase, partial [Acidimicrobiia bacterium]